MNIHDFWPSEDQVPPFTEQAALSLLHRRRKSHLGFLHVEAQMGLLRPGMRLDTAPGQEAARIYVMRGIEEILEAWEAREEPHQKEEMIDAINYFWTLAIFDDHLWGEGRPVVSPFIIAAFSIAFPELREGENPLPRRDTLFKLEVLPKILNRLNSFLATLRNRGWQNAPQSSYFEGVEELGRFLTTITAFILSHFESWDEFWQYYVAKDEVLLWRIQSKY